MEAQRDKISVQTANKKIGDTKIRLLRRYKL